MLSDKRRSEWPRVGVPHGPRRDRSRHIHPLNFSSPDISFRYSPHFRYRFSVTFAFRYARIPLPGNFRYGVRMWFVRLFGALLTSAAAIFLIVAPVFLDTEPAKLESVLYTAMAIFLWMSLGRGRPWEGR